MLEFNPYFRPTVKQLLSNKIFDSVRIPENEAKLTHQIVIKADRSPQLAVDYNRSLSEENEIEEDQNITNDLIVLIIQEALKVNKQIK